MSSIRSPPFRSFDQRDDKIEGFRPSVGFFERWEESRRNFVYQSSASRKSMPLELHLTPSHIEGFIEDTLDHDSYRHVLEHLAHSLVCVSCLAFKRREMRCSEWPYTISLTKAVSTSILPANCFFAELGRIPTLFVVYMFQVKHSFPNCH